MDDRFFHGIIGCEASVCGRRLNSLTPWHVLLLHAIDSPLVTGERAIYPGDIIIFTKVLSVSYPETPNLRPTTRDLFWRIRLNRQKAYLRQVKTIKGWLNIQMSVPKLWQVLRSNGEVKKDLTSPAMFALVVALVSQVNVTLAEAWNMRVSEARWYDTVKAELEGGDLNIAYDNEEESEDILSGLTDDEKIEFARGKLPPAMFDRWLTARKLNTI
jgi:hypothetical protein